MSPVSLDLRVHLRTCIPHLIVWKSFGLKPDLLFIASALGILFLLNCAWFCARGEGTPCWVCGSQLTARGIGSLLPVSVGSGGGTQVARVVWQPLILLKIKSISKICKIK